MSSAALARTELHFEEGQEQTGADSDWHRLFEVFDGAPREEGDYPAFISYFSCHGPELTDVFSRLHEEAAEERDGECETAPSLVERLVSFGVRSDRVELVAQAETLSAEAYIIAEEDINHERLGTGEVRDYVTRGRLAIWQHSFARTMLRHAMFRGFAPDSWVVRFAVTHALDQAREAYGTIAAAAELQAESDAAA